MYSKKAVWAAILTFIPVLYSLIAMTTHWYAGFGSVGLVIAVLSLLASWAGLGLVIWAVFDLGRNREMKGWTCIILAAVFFIIQNLIF